MSPNQILYDISHQNLLLYAASIPNFESEPSNKGEKEDLDWGGKMDYSNPDNFSNNKDRERI